LVSEAALEQVEQRVRVAASLAAASKRISPPKTPPSDEALSRALPLTLRGLKEKMSTKLYVGNLSFRTTGDELRELFSQAGEVETATVVEDRDTGRSRGFGFVEMATQEGAAAAIEQFNGKEFSGRTLTVNEARPRAERGGYGGGGGGGGREPRW
jgi:RNA recognition motif-containing protein